MMRLQNENTELIRELCETKAENNDIRGTRHPVRGNSLANPRRQPNDISHKNPANCQTKSREGLSQLGEGGNDGRAPIRRLLDPKNGELESLYEPFAAMWNLIRLDPSVVKGKVSAQTVFDRLRGMVEVGDPSTGAGKSRSHSTSHSADSPGSFDGHG